MTEIPQESQELYSVYTGIIAMNPTFQKAVDGEVSVEIDLSSPKLKKLAKEYQLEALRGSDDLSTTLNLLGWVTDHIKHGNKGHDGVHSHALELLPYAINQPEHPLTCRDQAITLSECLLALGIPAYPIWLMPYSPFDFDNHVVTQVYISDLAKWIMIDSTSHTYVMNKSGDILDAFELRRAFGNREELHLNSDTRTHNEPWPEDEHYKLLEYYSKNCAYLEHYTRFGYGVAEEKPGMFTFAPEGFDVIKREIANYDFRINDPFFTENYSEFIPEFKRMRDEAANQTITYVNPEQVKYIV